MKRKINKSLMGTATLAILATLLLTVAVCYNLYKEQILDDLSGYAGTVGYLLCTDIEAGEIKKPESFGDNVDDALLGLKEALETEHIRMTIIGEDGTVVYDTAASAEDMENHKARPEVKEAFLNGEGRAIRKSDTLGQNTYYCAVLLENGFVLRIARDAGSIYSVMDYAVPYTLAVVVVLLLICAVASYYLSEDIIKPVKLIARNVEDIEKLEVYEEMKPYIEAIKNQHEDVLQNARIRQEFTANVSHELKTPLTAISGYAELIENGMVAEQAEVKRFSKEIHQNANRLLTLINDVIRLSELDDSEAEEQFEPINLRESAENCVNMLQINAEKHNVSLTLEGENTVIMANKQMLEEVLYNLCDNAIRYNRENGKVEVFVKDRLNTAVLIVKDTGIGIPKEHQERIFERFYRVDKSRSKSTGGTGLGLAIVKHILIKLNATIVLESEEGKGTEITVTFPAIRGAQFR